jgi:hypothetical protein
MKKNLNEHCNKKDFVVKDKIDSKMTEAQKAQIKINNKMRTDQLKLLNRFVKSAPDEMTKNKVLNR